MERGAHVTHVGISSAYLRGLLLSQWPLSFQTLLRQGCALRAILKQQRAGFTRNFEIGGGGLATVRTIRKDPFECDRDPQR